MRFQAMMMTPIRPETNSSVDANVIARVCTFKSISKSHAEKTTFFSILIIAVVVVFFFVRYNFVAVLN